MTNNRSPFEKTLYDLSSGFGPLLWDLTHHPWGVLQAAFREKIRQGLADPLYRKKIDALVRSKERAARASAWLQEHRPRAPLSCVAYFSMEFMLSAALRPGHPHGLGGADAGKHGVADTSLLSQPRGSRIHRETLPPGGSEPLHAR